MKAKTAEETFEQYILNTKNSFIETITKWFPHENSVGQNKEMRSEIRVAAEDMIIAYDQLRQKQLEHTRQHLQAMADEISKSKWIDVKDRLPEEGEQVFTFFISDEEPSMAFAIFTQGKFFEGHLNTKHQYTENVTHWQPLPEPPKT